MISPNNSLASRIHRSYGLAGVILIILVAAGAIVYWQGHVALVTGIEERIAEEAGHSGSLLEQALGEIVVRLESSGKLPIMARILDNDEDHEIAELLDVVVGQSRSITELTCFDSGGDVIASTNSSWLGAKAAPNVVHIPDGLRYVLSNESGEERVIVPVVQQFDKLERIGTLMAVIDRAVLLRDLNAWWTGLISGSGDVLVDGAPHQIVPRPIPDNEFTHPDLGIVRINQMQLKMPEGGAVAHPWILANATPAANRFQPVRVLGRMITLTTLLSSGLVLAVVYYFSRKQRDLLGELSDQCLRLEATTQELGQKKKELEQRQEETEAVNTELMIANQHLEEARAQAVLATQAKTHFLANMSHEIRTPMTAILGFAENLRDGDLSESEKRDAIDTVYHNGQHLLGLINDILDMSKIESGRMTVENIPCSPHQIIADVTSLMQVRTKAKKLSFSTEYIGAIPEMIQSDPMRLRQILLNIIGNSVKFTHEGGIRIITQFVPDEATPWLQFTVLDTGVGMTEAHAANLFQPFTQADTTMTRKFGGTGLGLTISKHFADLLGGDLILVDTKPGHGAQFRITVQTGSLAGIRMIENHRIAMLEKRFEKPMTSSADNLLNCRILLAEDGPDNQRLISFVLRKAGADVTVAENGQIAVDKALATWNAGKPFDVILMDMQMPVLDGYRATMALRKKHYEGPIIALTAHAMAEDREKCIHSGCDDFATKPIERAKLIEMIEAHLHPATEKPCVIRSA